MKTQKEPIKAKCLFCHGYGLAADLWGAGYRWPMNKEQSNTTLARVNCDRCGCGGTEKGEETAERSRGRLASIKAKNR